MYVVGIDPGPASSAYAIIERDCTICEAAKVPNDALEVLLATTTYDRVVLESIQSYGKPVGRETFETCYAIGAYRYIAMRKGVEVALVPRQEYANAICGGKANDSMLRQALLLRFGGDKKGEPLAALKGHTDLRSAFAVAVYYLDTLKWRRPQFNG